MHMIAPRIIRYDEYSPAEREEAFYRDADGNGLFRVILAIGLVAFMVFALDVATLLITNA